MNVQSKQFLKHFHSESVSVAPPLPSSSSSTDPLASFEPQESLFCVSVSHEIPNTYQLRLNTIVLYNIKNKTFVQIPFQ